MAYKRPRHYEEKSVSQLIEDLKTNTETGLDTLEGREEAAASVTGVEVSVGSQR